jgi:hypothetical protein
LSGSWRGCRRWFEADAYLAHFTAEALVQSFSQRDLAEVRCLLEVAAVVSRDGAAAQAALTAHFETTATADCGIPSVAPPGKTQGYPTEVPPGLIAMAKRQWPGLPQSAVAGSASCRSGVNFSPRKRKPPNHGMPMRMRSGSTG